MQACDRAAIEEYRIPGALLMENAGLQVLDALHEINGGAAPLSTAVVCGGGNNGGDGFVVARHLYNLGREAIVYLVGDPEALSGDARLNHDIAVAFGVTIVPLGDSDAADMAATLARFEYVIDALLGSGIQGAARGTAAAVIAAMNESPTPIIAIDLPSGLQADRGAVEGETVRASATVALAALKACHVLAPACECCGAISLAEISLPAPLLEAAEASLLLTEPSDVAGALPWRAAESHKGSFGRVLVIGGAPGTAGAAALTARGAMRSGAGLVDVVCPESVYEMIGAAATEALVHPMPAGDDGSLGVTAADLAELVAAATAVVIGPGLGTGAAASTLVRELVRGALLPLVVDADGLNALGDELATVAESAGPRILTPHPGEAGKLLGCDTRDVQADRPAAARELADRSGAIVVLKGYRSLIAAPGQVTVVNPTGNPGMATGGTGDVLAGAIGALIGQGCEPFRAAWVGAWLHGAAGDAAADDVGEISMTAGDLAAALPAAFAAIAEQE